MKDRRTFLKQAGLVGLAGILPVNSLLADDLKENILVDSKE